jgi:hypothetical protein
MTWGQILPDDDEEYSHPATRPKASGGVDGVRRGVLWSGIAAVTVVLAYGVLLMPWAESNVATVIASVVIDPGWRVAVLVFPEGVHAGIPFVATSIAVNVVLYTGIAFLVLLLVPHLPRTGRRE